MAPPSLRVGAAMYAQRKTISANVGITGIGLHSGIYTKLELLPAPVRSGITFVRSDLNGLRIAALQASTTALDHATASRIIEDLRAWNAAHRIPILYVTHAHREVFALGEHVVVLERGIIAASGSPHEVLETPPHERLAQLAGFENIFSGVIVANRADAGTMQCQLTGGTEGPIGIPEQLAVVEGTHTTPAVIASASSGVPAAMS